METRRNSPTFDGGPDADASRVQDGLAALVRQALRVANAVRPGSRPESGWALLLGALLCLGSGLRVGAQEVVAVVGTNAIAAEQVRQAVVRGGRNIYSLDAARETLTELVNHELLALGARRDGLEHDPEVRVRIQAILVEAYVRRSVDAPLDEVVPTESELKAHYEAHQADFGQPAMRRGQVLTFLVRNAKGEEALTRAQKALQLLQGGQSYSEVAAAHADDPSERVQPGGGSWFTEGQSQRRYPDEVTRTLFAGRLGEWSRPVQTPRAIYLVLAVEERAAVIQSFAEARPAVMRAVRQARRQEAYEALCQRLQGEFPVTVHEGRLPLAVEKSQPGAGPPAGPVKLK